MGSSQENARARRDIPGVVHVVHCIDTEGPLFESMAETFHRINSLFGLNLTPSFKTLEGLKTASIPLAGKEIEIAKLTNGRLLEFCEDWQQVEAMLSVAMSRDFRNQWVDSYGNGWVYNWFCMDHMGFQLNPRRRDIGFAHIYDRYVEFKDKFQSPMDGLHFHFHPINYDKAAHHCATHYFAQSNTLFSILAYRVLERSWFPSCYRPGFHLTRPDSHWFLEQYIPFEFANQRYDRGTSQPDLQNGRFGDWRRAPNNWQPYHPHPDDYESIGSCRRYIARCLNVGTRVRLLDQELVNQAFQEAADGKPCVLSFADHDWRDIRPDVIQMVEMLKRAKELFPKVPFKYSEARSAMRESLGIESSEHPRFSIEWDNNTINIESDRDIFGPQPFLAIKSCMNDYWTDNFDIHLPFRRWSYTFDEHSLPLKALAKVGFAANDARGNTSVCNIELAAKEPSFQVY